MSPKSLEVCQASSRPASTCVPLELFLWFQGMLLFANKDQYLSSANERYEILQAVLAQFSAIVFCHDKSYVTFRENGRYLHDEWLRYFGRLKVVSF